MRPRLRAKRRTHLLLRLKEDSASAAEAACLSPCVSAPSCSKRRVTAHAKRYSPLMSVLTMT